MLFNHASLLGISYLLSVLYSKLNWLQSLCYDLVMTFVSTRSLSSYECKRTFIEKNGFDLTLVAKIISQILQIQPVLDQCPYEQVYHDFHTLVSPQVRLKMNGKKPSRFQFHFSGVLEAFSMLKKWKKKLLAWTSEIIQFIWYPIQMDRTERSIFGGKRLTFSFF